VATVSCTHDRGAYCERCEPGAFVKVGVKERPCLCHPGHYCNQNAPCVGSHMEPAKLCDCGVGEPHAPGELHTAATPTEKLTNPKDIVGSNKLPLHLFPLTAVAAGCLAFLEGVLKYGRSNFRVVGVRSSIYYDAARRHLDSWFEGEDIDPESGIDHLGKALACIAVLIDAKAAGKLNDDRMVRGGYAEHVARLTPLVAELKARHADKSPTHYTIADNGR
jgi:hypothetical protein